MLQQPGTKSDSNQGLSLVVLDEVGLAEDSPSFPLKALHPLLEDGTDGSDMGDKVRSYMVVTGISCVLHTNACQLDTYTVSAHVEQSIKTSMSCIKVIF